MIELARVNINVNHEVGPLFLNCDAVRSTGNYNYSGGILLAASDISTIQIKVAAIQYILFYIVVRTTGSNQKSAVAECIEPHTGLIKRKEI